jgi:hypothetical protein
MKQEGCVFGEQTFTDMKSAATLLDLLTVRIDTKEEYK